MEADLVTFALAASLNEVGEAEILDFFKKQVRCGRSAALAALADSKDLLAQLGVALQESQFPRVFTIGMLRSIVCEFLADKQTKDDGWEDMPPQPTNMDDRLALTNPQPTNMDNLLALAVSQLQPGQFIVKARTPYVARDLDREHSFSVGDIFVIDQVRHLNDGTQDAWLCGFRLGATNVRKWIFSEFTEKIVI